MVPNVQEAGWAPGQVCTNAENHNPTRIRSPDSPARSQSDILKGQNIIGFIRKQRLNWFGHVTRMAEDNIVQKIKRWKPMYKRPIGRPKTRWENYILEYIKSINIGN